MPSGLKTGVHYKLPRFGAKRLKLRYDAPISVSEPKTGALSPLPYEKGWDEKLEDVVVSLPNGSIFVFWRGSSYIPFWAGLHNVGLCTEWAENLSRLPGAVDCVEPLMDKELRYGRVDIVESTTARVHVRWTYQSTDLNYRVWGDEAVEDYYFYPDGFGTRVVSLKSDPSSEYELSELIVVAPIDAFPFSFLPERPITVLGADGSKHEIAFPVDRAAETAMRRISHPPAVYRVRSHKNDTQTAIYFNPGETELPPLIFAPFSDGGEIVTPAYWGSHWPLARGNATGNAIDDRIRLSPSHLSLMSWAKTRPRPIDFATIPTLDALGRSAVMNVRRWAWLVGMSDAPDERIRAIASSYAHPPSIHAQGARPRFDAYSLERRAIRLVAEGPDLTILVQFLGSSVNPVFEIDDAPAKAIRLELNDKPLPRERYAWDGRVLWIDVALEAESRLRIHFGDPARTP